MDASQYTLPQLPLVVLQQDPGDLNPLRRRRRQCMHLVVEDGAVQQEISDDVRPPRRRRCVQRRAAVVIIQSFVAPVRVAAARLRRDDVPERPARGGRLERAARVLLEDVLGQEAAPGVFCDDPLFFDMRRRVRCGSRPVCKSTSVSGSFLGEDAAVLARSSGEEPASPRHRAGVTSMEWRTTRRFRTKAP